MKIEVIIKGSSEDIYIPLVRETTLEDIKKLSEMEAYEEGFGLNAYAILKNSSTCLEYSSKLYEMYIVMFLRMLDNEYVSKEIMADISIVEPETLSSTGVINAFIEASIWKIEQGEQPASKYEMFIEKLCGKMTSGLLYEIASWSLKEDIVNIKLDFLLLSLRLIVMVMEDKIEKKRKIEKKNIFAFAKEYFYKTFVFLGEIKDLEDDMTFVFKASLAIDALVTGQVAKRVNEVFPIIEDLPISGKNMFRIHIQMANICLYEDGALYDLLYLVFTSNCFTYLDASYKNKFIGTLIEAVEQDGKIEKTKSIADTFRKIFHSLRDSESKNTDLMIWNFLSFLSKLRINKDMGDFNSIFLKFIVKYPETIELYSNFILINEVDFPLHSLHEISNFGFMKEFYSILFKKAQEKRYSKAHVDKLVSEFLKFFLSTKNRELIGVLPLVPYIPSKREVLYVLYEIYSFLFENEAIEQVDLFLLKTPALVGISSSIYYNVKYLHQLAAGLNLRNVEPRMLVFLGIVYYCESRKLYNSNYTGILEYIQDEDGIRMARDGLISVIELIHNGYINKSHEFTFSYVNALLNIALEPKTIETTLMMIEIILRKIFEKEEKIIFMKEIHQRFQKLFVLLTSKRFLSEEVTDSYRRLYRQMLEKIRCAPNFYNYVVLCLADISFFDGELPKGHFKSFNDLYNHTLSRMGVVEEFPDIFMVDHGWNSAENTEETSSKSFMSSIQWKENRRKYGIRGKEEGLNSKEEKSHDMYNIIHTGTNDSVVSLESSMGSISLHSSSPMHSVSRNGQIEMLDEGIRKREKSVSWLIDVIYTRRSQSSIIRIVLDLLKLRLRNMFEYEDLYILLKAYNILSIRENDSEEFLKHALHRGLDFKTDPAICYKLSMETNGFYRFFFRALYFAVSNFSCNDDLSFPERTQLISKFDIADLIHIQNTFKQKIVQKLLERSSTPSYRSYFFNMESLGIIDCLTIIRRIDDPSLVSKAFERLKDFRGEMLFYVPQLVQMIRHKKVSEMALATLKDLAKDEYVAHQLIWNLKANLYGSDRTERDDCHDIFTRCMEEIMGEMTEEERDILLKEEEFISSLTKISSELIPHLRSSKDEKRRRINEHLSKIKLSPGVYIPFYPELKIVEIMGGSARALQSHAKVPFMASFRVQDPGGQINIKQLIFKSGDDCRQDMLALQIISMFESIFKQANLDIFLYPYRVIATSPGTGIIEVIPNSKSRDQIGKENINNLSEYFEYKFGFKESEGYLTAICNFASSLAGYSLVVYFLNIKDRHNGNIMIDDKGRMIHIDFGYILEMSPGNLNIEAPLKLTKEIEELLGGISGKGFEIYQELMVKGFLALRRHSKDLVMMVDSFSNSRLPCYKKNAVENFALRFRLELSDKNARRFVQSLIAESSQKFRTWMYDQYQKITNNIAF
ncbi:phosphatidylinositol 4-kinase [Encephalitozoon intestinalis ATCC 50506]|uniref:1-phosphatidylinositol 4-kinase n=1 Tax=Encephalitozoon intestinalis (strain ATCC 50506) TaxID=876142 RepID=E0SAA5_ENCIT|nr:phosphatidylinositol 4-kinase [Encephalitozoon intestinalis ATCC 50506]ADM12530.1 phosphatidylinositol 4-kinase [Encephalitozoon intestinalis ATCC 50506]UTX46383.1 phosphatidylinositol-4-kinase type-III catalytic subunit alpha [Encephalitozoon intestinalis]